jgi:integrase
VDGFAVDGFAVDGFEEWLRAKGLAQRTVAMTTTYVVRAAARYPSPLDVLDDEALAATTRTVYAKALLRWARWQERPDIEAEVKERWPVSVKRAAKVRALGLRSEWPAFIAALDARREADPATWAVVRLLAFGGLRIADALGVTRAQLEEVLERGHVTIKQKAGADRILAVTEDLYEPLSVLAEATPRGRTVEHALRTRRRRSRSAVESHLRVTIAAVGYAAGIPRTVTPHTLRRTLGHAVRVATGGDLIAARDALGQSDVRTTTEWYLDDAEPEELGRNLEKAAALLRGGR